MNSASAAAPQHDRPREVLPTRWASLLFRGKAACFQARRALQNLLQSVPRHRPGECLRHEPVAGAFGSDLWMEAHVAAERRLQLGKVQNLRVAARQLHGLEIAAGAVLSFWRQLGRPLAARGYAEGRELREGCLVPTIGGGLCQLSGALYNAALQAGCEVVERHRHSHPGVGTLAALGRDATIFWNYVDLRLRAPFPWRLEVTLSASRLEIRIRRAGGPTLPSPTEAPAEAPAAEPLGSCASCGVSQCFRHLQAEEASPAHTAWVVDESWPEWLAHRRREAASGLLIRPLDGQRWRKPNYAWPIQPNERVQNLTWTTLRRAWSTRRLREQGAERQRALLAWDERLARAASRQLGAEQAHLVVAQNLLPFLWREGALGGRTFDVLMTRLPLAQLQDTLDRAARLHPNSPTCADFRAPDELVEAEAEALAAAAHWLTPHSAIACLAGSRAQLLPWSLPPAPNRLPRSGRCLVFAASTLGRKGAYEMREVARELDLELVCLGGTSLEGPDFWRGVRIAPADPAGWLEQAAAVVLPAFVEHRPRRLLTAVAAGVPVIASSACGLGGLPGVHEIEAGDPSALRSAVLALPAFAAHAVA